MPVAGDQYVPSMERCSSMYREYTEICIQRHDKQPSRKAQLTPESARQIRCLA